MATKGKNNVTNDEVSRLIKMVLIVTGFFLIFYVITLFVTKEEEVETPKTPATIQYDEILIGNLLEQPKDEYYVLVYDKEDIYVDLYITYLIQYEQSRGRYYTAKMENPLNAKFVSSESKLNVSNVLDLRVSQSTLFKVEDGKIVKSFEGNEKIKNHLSNLIKEVTKK